MSGRRTLVSSAFDINEVMLRRGQERALQLGLSTHIQIFHADLNSWSPVDHYDIVTACYSLHHLVALERIFNKVMESLTSNGYFLVADMIGRNGHQRWPEALDALRPFWEELPQEYRYNWQLKRVEPEYVNHDCSQEGFEGVRSQDILPLLAERFHFELFLPFSNIIMVFIDRAFGPNFDPTREWDRCFIDRVHRRDEEGLMKGELKPTQMLAALATQPVEMQLLVPHLTPQFCIRDSNA